MPISVTVKHRDGSTTNAEVWASTEVAFEEKFGVAWSEAFSMAYPRQTYIYFSAYHASVEAGKTALSFENWMKTVGTVELEGDEEDPKDSDQAQQPGSSES